MVVIINGKIVDTKKKEMLHAQKKYLEFTDAIGKCGEGAEQYLCVISAIVRLTEGIARNKEGALELLDAAARSVKDSSFEEKENDKIIPN